MTTSIRACSANDILSEILATDRRIRYAGILSANLQEVQFKAREDARSYDLIKGKETAFERLVKIDVPIILGSLSQLCDKYGNLTCTGVRFDNLTLMFFKMDESYVVVATDPGPPYQIMQKLEEKFQAGTCS
jgi:hypothetical protein